MQSINAIASDLGNSLVSLGDILLYICRGYNMLCLAIFGVSRRKQRPGSQESRSMPAGICMNSERRQVGTAGKHHLANDSIINETTFEVLSAFKYTPHNRVFLQKHSHAGK